MDSTLIHLLATNPEPASGGLTDMLFVGGAGALMLAAVGALAAMQSRGDPGTPPGVPDTPAPDDAQPS
ncbi:hypothetical protein WEI85_43530 [Actinomycetes bacterium KLBMP 9797]